jgi:hypothetical protein
MLATILGFFGGPLINGLIAGYKAKLTATQTSEALAADLAAQRIAAEIESRREARTIIVAEQGRWYTALPRPLFALIVLIYVGKVVLWDSVLGWGSTPAIGGAVGEWMGWIVAAYFGGRTVEKVAQTVTRRRR